MFIINMYRVLFCCVSHDRASPRVSYLAQTAIGIAMKYMVDDCQVASDYYLTRDVGAFRASWFKPQP